ncbi:MAG: hypothetical protein SOZ02_07225 [Hallerella porci]|nr:MULTISPECIES: hypothetical protein [Fibrobacteraceae]MCI5599981.1 hypothetical protein [Hallerella sp.]MDD7298215.1 hypothetical protein [Fibrobacter intestinalis]MDY3921934.1 hypothetical protein [Hallerella porci]
MSRKDRRKAMQDAKNFTPKKRSKMSTLGVSILAAIVVVAWIAFVMARN